MLQAPRKILISVRTIPQGQICEQLTPGSLHCASLCLSHRLRHIGKIRFKDLKTVISLFHIWQSNHR